MRLVSLLCLLLVSVAPRGAHAQDEEPPPTDDPELAAVLAQLHVEVESGVSRVPANAVERRSADGRYHASRDGRTLYTRGYDGGLWRSTLTGPDLPRPARFVPVVDIDTVQEVMYGDDSFALLIPGEPNAFLFGMTTYETLPVENTGGGIVRTEYARAMRACPVSRQRCVLVGRPSDVAAAEDPVAPEHGWFLVRHRPPTLDPAARYTRAAELPTDIEGATLVVETGPHSQRGSADRVYLRYRGRLEHAFDAAPGRVGVQHGGRAYFATQVGRRIYVHDGGGTVATFDARTGRRLGEPVIVGLEPYYDICLAGDDGFSLYPVLGPRGASFAMVFFYDQVAYHFAQPGGDSVRRSVSIGPDDDDRYYGMTHLERRGHALVPRLPAR